MSDTAYGADHSS